jgi:hypothetical protein
MEKQTEEWRGNPKRRREVSPPLLSPSNNPTYKISANGSTVKKQGSQEDSDCLPAPLTRGHFELVLHELPTGARLALQTCLASWRNGNFSTDDFISFIKCYTCYSITLDKIFNSVSKLDPEAKEERERDEEEAAHECRMKDDPNGTATAAYDILEPSQRTPNQEEITRNKMRREAALHRRCWGIQGAGKVKLGRYLASVLQELRFSLNIDGRQQFERILSEYLDSHDTHKFSLRIKDLVDQHQVVVQLSYTTAKYGPYIRHVPAAQRKMPMPQQHQQVVYFSFKCVRLMCPLNTLR